jgi:hypothetical protein
MNLKLPPRNENLARLHLLIQEELAKRYLLADHYAEIVAAFAGCHSNRSEEHPKRIRP